MLEGTAISKRSINYFLLILPGIYGLVITFFFLQSKYFFTTIPDPVYAYLFNGANLAGGILDIGHYDHPGTPVQLFAGLVIFIAHIFIDSSPTNESVISNPELYLGICAVVLICLLIISVYISGNLIYKHTANLALSLAFQLIPISGYMTITFMTRLMPEAILIICLNYYLAFLWILCYEKEKFQGSLAVNRKIIAWFSFFTALLITTKITCLPFIIIPLFFLKKISHKSIFFFTTLVFAALITIPVWSKFPKMFSWFRDLATHSGYYGGGRQEFLDPTTFFNNLWQILFHELFFTLGYFTLSIAVITGFILKIRGNNYFKLSLAFWIICTIQVILTGKHFKYYYILPSQLLIIPGLLASYNIFFKVKLNKLLSYSVLLICSTFLICKFAGNSTAFNFGTDLYRSGLKAKQFDSIPRIITTGYQGSSYVESALHFGSAYGGDNFFSSNYFLRKKYTNSYFYDIDNKPGFIMFWDIKVDPVQLVEKNPKVLFYFLGVDVAEERWIMDNLFGEVKPGIKNSALLEENIKTGEHFYIIHYDTANSALHYGNQIEILCDFEKKSTDNSRFISSDPKYNIGEVKNQSGAQYFSGNNSVLIPPGEYSFISYYQVSPGDAIDISVNYLAAERPVGILLSGTGSSFNETSESIVEKYENGWGTVSVKAIIPKDVESNEIVVYLFNFGHEAAFADDVKILIRKRDSRSNFSIP